MPFALAHISHAPHHCIPTDHIWRWHVIEHSPSVLNAHILHTCPPSYSPQRHQTCNHFEWAVHEQACLQVLLNQHMC
jgi:hypothetical protein